MVYGMCPDCHQRRLERNDLIMAAADQRAIAEASRRVLAGLANTNKGEPTTPAIMDAALRHLGGTEELGKMIAKARSEANGDNLTPQQLQAGVKPSRQLAFKYDELLVRMAMKNDERESLEISNLTDEELRSTLKGLTEEIISESEDYRRMMIQQILEHQPDLIHDAMNAAGMPLVEGESKALSEDDILDAGLDDDYEEDD